MRGPLVVCVMLAASGTAAAERPVLRVDVEPAAYVLRGYSVHLRATNPWVPRLVGGVGAYGFDMPRMLVDVAAGNRDEPWSVRLVVGANVFADYFFGAHADHGWLAGAQLGVQHYRVRRAGEEGRVDTLLLMARVGYEWHPWRQGFYLFPWLGAALGPVLGDVPAVDGDAYDVAPVVPYGAVELGWRF
jgi:hypothetical protein